MMNTDHLSEDDISVKYITPALHKAGWDEETQIRRQVSFTKGRITCAGRMVSRESRRKPISFYMTSIALIEMTTSKVIAQEYSSRAFLPGA